MKYTFSNLEIRTLIDDLDNVRIGEAEPSDELIDRALETLMYLQDRISDKEEEITRLRFELKENKRWY